MMSTIEYKHSGTVLDVLPATNHCSAYHIDSLHTYLHDHPSDPLADYIPGFSSVVQCGAQLAMVMPLVDTPFSVRAFKSKAGRNIDAERQLALSLSNVAKRLAMYYASLDANSNFAVLIDFSLQNVAIVPGKQSAAHVQFVDIESFKIADGSIGTLLIEEDIIDGYSILTTDDADTLVHKLDIVHKRFKCSMITMLAVLSLKALHISSHKDMDQATFYSLLERPPISTTEQVAYLEEFSQQFLFDLQPLLADIVSGKATTHTQPLNLYAEFTLGKNAQHRMCKVRRSREHSIMTNALATFAAGPTSITHGFDKNNNPCLKFSSNSIVEIIDSGSFGTIIPAPMLVPSTTYCNHVVKLWSHIVGRAPVCMDCITPNTVKKLSIVHYCKWCKTAFCKEHLDNAVCTNSVHLPSCKYVL